MSMGVKILAAEAVIIMFLTVVAIVNGQLMNSTLVPAIMIFGDSSVDVGNNNHLIPAMFKADFIPYGRDFINHLPSGRFCNGKLVTDFTAETLGFKTYPEAYPGKSLITRKSLSMGANFASAGSGYCDMTSLKYNAIPLSRQVENFKDYRLKLVGIEGKARTESLIKDATYIVSTGTGDYVQNYYINPALRRAYNPERYSSLVIESFSRFIKELYGQGARRIGVTTLLPLGCLPAVINLHGKGKRNSCISRFNDDAQFFNNKMRATIVSLTKQLTGIKIAVLDIYKPILDLAINATQYGFTESKRGCCGTGTSGTTVLCKPKTPLACQDASKYVFWDGVHPSEAANRYIASSVMLDGIPLLP